MKKIALVTSTESEGINIILSALSNFEVALEEFDISKANQIVSQNYDAVVIVSSNPEIEASVQILIQNFHEDSSPIGAFHLAPYLVAQALGDHGVAITIGNNPSQAAELEKNGAQYVDCEVDDFITDRQNKVVTTPSNANEVGIKKAIAELFEMA